MENAVPQAPLQPAPPPTPPSNIGRITIIIAVILFFAGLFLYLSSADQTQPRSAPEQTLTQTRPTPSADAETKAERVPGQIIVKFKEGVSQDEIAARLQPLNASVKNTIEGIGTTVLNVPPGEEEAILKELSDDPLVKYAEPDYVYYLDAVPNDPSFNQQWGFMNTGQTVSGRAGTADADIDAEQAWDVTRGNGVKVAILDSGIDPTHPEFANKIVGTKFFATSMINDVNGHGTHVAGILAANANNGQGISGICPECQLLIGKITLDDAAGSVPSSSIAPSILWAADSGAKVINMSIAGTNFSQAVQDAVNQAWSKNAVLVSAAGNDGSSDKRYPGAYDHVIGVASVNNDDELTGTSSFGTWVALAAPGDRIFSTYPTTPNFRNVTNYGFLGGTSMASPAVSGVAALVWTTQYGINNAAVVQRLFDTADKISGTGTDWMHGRVNAAKAVGAGATPTPTVAPTITTAPSQAVPTAAPTTAPTTEPQAQLTVIPTFFCGGSADSVCPTVPPAYPIETQTPPSPSAATPVATVAPTGVAVYPTLAPIDLPEFEPEKVPGSKHHKKSQGGVGQFIALLLGLFFALIQWILGIFGVR